MNQITVHFHTDQERVDPTFFDNLERLAQQYGLQVEDKADQPQEERQRRIAEFLRKADELAEKIGPVPSDSADDIRDMRDSR